MALTPAGPLVLGGDLGGTSTRIVIADSEGNVIGRGAAAGGNPTSHPASAAANFGQAGKTFSQGDFNYDGLVDTIDFNSLASNFGQSLPSEPVGIGTVVPEPLSVALLAIVPLAVSARSKRRRRYLI